MYFNVLVSTGILICLNLINPANSYRILGIFPFPSRSHYFLASNLLKGLAEAGHDVTFITPFSDPNFYKSPNGSWREIHLEEHVSFFKERQEKMNINAASTNDRLRIFFMMLYMHQFTSVFAEKTLDHPKVEDLINSDEKFDAVILTDFMLDSLKVLAYHFDANLIMFSNTALMTWNYRYTGASTMPSYFPNIFIGTPPKLNFVQRFVNTVFRLIVTFSTNFLSDPSQEAIAKKYFPNAPSLHEISYNISLHLINGHISVNYALPRVPLMVDVGGFHLQPPKTLPGDLKTVMDGAKDGVIYFSLGSHFKSDDLPPEKIEALLKVFAKRKEIVMWKWAQDTLVGKPQNVMIAKWFPQQDVLAHPNLKLFITHGGFLSTTETVYHGVPILAIPLMADQKQNAITAYYSGFGRYISVADITEENFEKELEEILNNPNYRENVKKRSALMNDRRHKPIEDAVYWVEYVIRNEGAQHLRVNYADMPWYQYFLLDVLALLAAIILISLILFTKSVCFVLRKFKKDKKKIKKS